MGTVTIDNKVRQVLSNVQNLPTPPVVFHQIQKVVNNPNCSAAQVASVLSEDPAMSVKVLKLTNSAFYGLSREVDSVKQAVVIVGMEAVKNLVLSASVLDMFKGEGIDLDLQERYWRHSLATAACCRILTRKVKSRWFIDPDSAFSAGLLHDIGKIVLASFLKVEASLVRAARAKSNTETDWTVEERVLGYNHTQIGAFMAVHWKLPEKLCDAIMYHHALPIGQPIDPLIPVVHLANLIAKKTFYDKSEAYLVGQPDPSVSAYLNLTNDDMVDTAELLKNDFQKAETFMQLAGLN